MRNLFHFLLELGKLKGKYRRGWTIHQIKNPETTAEHIFHLAFLVWVLGKSKNLNLERAIKMALMHDICEVYAPDLTSYDAVALKERGKITINDILKIKPIPGRPTTKQRKKMEKIKQKLEMKAIKKLISKLPSNLKNEIKELWLDYENGRTKEGRFVKEADKTINLLQGMVYWKKYGKIPYRLWIRRYKEVLDDPDLIKFASILENEFCGKPKKKNKKL